MQSVVVLLAIVGALALAHRLVRSVARFLLSFADTASATGMAEVSQRRGDLTAMAERRSAERVARRRQRRDLVVVLGWFGWLLLPPLIGLALPLYAAAAPVWLFPRTPIRSGA
jgi:hypothetical protein